MRQILCLIFIFFFISCDALDKLNREANEINKIEIEKIDISNVQDGTYREKIEYTLVKVEIELVVKNGLITSIKLIKHDNGKGKSAEKIVTNIITEQRLDIDTIAGATYSSKIILKTIELALKRGLNN